jgi:ketosteroid isomerase-like protein
MTEPPVLQPRDVFAQQIKHVLDDDRNAQLKLFAEDCVWEFPFAEGDFPRRMVGREEIRRLMSPYWEKTRGGGSKPESRILNIHETSDPEVIVAEFDFFGPNYRIPFAQVLRVRGNMIIEFANMQTQWSLPASMGNAEAMRK